MPHLGERPCRRRSGRRARRPAIPLLRRLRKPWTTCSRRRSELVDRYDEELPRRAARQDAEIFDAHVHLGHDIDGMVGDYDELERIETGTAISRAFMFCLDEPDRHPAFQAANDRTLEFARALGRPADPVRAARPRASEPIEEAARCLDAGARGIKLHPRAQRFLLNDERLGAGLRARGRAARADPDPRRPRPAADRRRPRAARRALPGGAADHRPRRDRRPGRRSPSRFGGKRGRLLRHLRLEPDRPARLLPPRLAGAGRLRLRLPVRAAAGVAPHRAADRARSRASTRSELRGMLAGNASRIADGERAARADRAARRRTFSQPMQLRAHPPVPLDGDAAALDAPAGHDRRARPRAQRLRRARRRTPRSASGSASCSRPRATLWRVMPELDDEDGAARRAAGRRSGSSTSRTSWR